MSYYKPGKGYQEEPEYNAPTYEEKSAYYSDRTPLAAPEPVYEPHHGGYDNHDQKFTATPYYRDWVFALLFLFHLVGVFILLGVGISKDDEIKGGKFEEFIPTDHHTKTLLLLCLACAGVAIFYAFAWLQFMKAFAKELIIGTIIANVVFWAALGVFLLIKGVIVGAIFVLLGALFNAFLYFLWRSRIPFASQMLKTISGLIKNYPGTTYFAYLSIVVQFVWVTIWIFTVIVAQRLVQPKDNHSQPSTTTSTTDPNNDHNKEEEGGFLVWLLFVFLLLSFYWVAQVIKNVVHVTASGTFATWYFLNGTNSGVGRNPSLGAFKRATTYSFGSICLGSLIVAALQTLRAIVRGFRRERDNILTCIADCILGIIENLVRYFNIYAFAQVAIYGKSYCQAARDTWELVKTSGVEAIINDNLISNVLGMGALLGGILTGSAGAVLGTIFLPEYWGTMIFLGFLIGFVLSMLTMEVVESGVTTIFVCFAMDPEALNRNDPELFHKFRTTYTHWGGASHV